MAKSKVKIDVNVDDKGSTKKVGVNAKKAGDALDKVGTSAHSTDRRLKGASQQSSNSSKNFSKMAQGISGGLVPAYATLASSLFAVSAAFNFLKSAGNLAQLQAGQVAYASATGTGLRTLANSISAATDEMITFQAASEAAAIGVAAGLSPDQLTRLGKAAKDTSIILGRDVTDSFNRLVRGVTKAEPELLDELGIILRLDDASENYKRTLGITGRELSTFEKSQAVANEVLGQAEEKYGKILAILEVAPNDFQKLGKAFDDITNKIKTLLEKFFAPLARVLTETPELAIAAFGLFGASILKTIVPSLGTIGASAKVAFTESKQATSAATSQLLAYNRALMAGRGQKRVGQALGAGAGAGIQATLGTVQKKLTGSYAQAMKDPSKLTKRQIQVMVKDYEKGTGQMMLLSKKQRTALIRDLKDLELANKITTGKMSTDTTVAMNIMKVGYANLRLAGTAALNGIKVAAAGLARGMNFLMSSLGWISLLVTGVMIVKDYINANKVLTPEQAKVKKEMEETAKRAEELGNKYKSLTDEMKKMPEVLRTMNEEGMGNRSQFMSMIGGGLSNLSKDDFKEGLDALAESQSEAIRLEEVYQQKLAALKKKEAEALKIGMDNPSLMKGAQAAVSGAAREVNMAKTAKDAQGTLDEVAQGTLDFINIQRANFAALDVGIFQNSKVFAELQKQLQQKITKDNKDEILQRLLAAKEFTEKVVKPQQKLQEENAKQAASLLQAYMPTSKYDAMVDGLKAEMTLLKQLQNDNKDFDQARLTTLNKQMELFRKMQMMERNHQKETKAFQILQLTHTRNMTPLQRERGNQELKVLEISQKRSQITDKINLIEKDLLANKDNLNQTEQHNLDMLKMQRSEQEAKLQLAKDELNVQLQLSNAFKEGFEGQTTKGIGDLIKGDESSFKDAALESVKAGLESTADELAKNMSTKVSDFLFKGGKKDLKPENADDVLKTVYDSATGALRVTMAAKTVADKTDPTKPTDSFTPSASEMAANDQYRKDTIARDAAQAKSDAMGPGPMQEVTVHAQRPKFGFQATAGELFGNESGAEDLPTRMKNVFDGFKTDISSNFDIIKDKFSGVFGKVKGMFTNAEGEGGLVGKFADVFKKNADGSGGFLSKMGGLFSGLGDTLGSLFSGGGGGGGLGGILSGIAGAFGFGGVGARQGGIMKQYATGGIARGRNAGYPAILHGTEAVVPLPNGNKIPVEMKGGAGNNITNNITVNVTKDGQSQEQNTGQDSSSNSEDHRLASALSMAVQEEIVKQQRPGGLLSAYGAG